MDRKDPAARPAAAWLRMLLAAGLLMCAVGGAHANSAKLQVTAVVRAVVRLQVLSPLPPVRITQADLARGWVEIPAPVQVAIRNNSGHGYLLAFDSQSDFFRQAHVRCPQGEVQVGPAGGVVAQQALPQGTVQQTVALGFRFELSPSAREGVYPWPLQMAAEPL